MRAGGLPQSVNHRPEPLRASVPLSAPVMLSARVPDLASDDVQHPMHAINEIDVERAGLAEHDLGPLGAPAARGMRGEILRSDIGLGLGDDVGGEAASSAPQQGLAEQVPRNLIGGAIEEFRCQRGGCAAHCPGQAVESPAVAMGLPLIKTLEEPVTTEPPQPVLLP